MFLESLSQADHEYPKVMRSLDSLETSQLEEEDSMPDKLTQIILSSAFVVVFFIMLCLSLFGRRMRPIPPARHGQEETREERRDRRRATKEERKKYIERTLVVKHVIRQRMAETASEDGSTRAGSHSTIDAEQLEGEEPCDPVVPNEEKEAKAYNPKQPIRRLKSNLIISDPDDLEAARDSTREPWICAICLTPYEIGDEICWSQNPECNHVFHHGCIEHWLYNHEECPMCRSIYISLGYDEVDAVPDPNQCCSSQVSSAPLVIMSTAEEQSHGTGEEEIMDLENPTGPALSTVEEVEGTSDGEVVDTF